MDKQVKRDRKIHIIVMTGMIAIMVLGLGVAVFAIQSGQRLTSQSYNIPEHVEEETQGEIKPLPDFILLDEGYEN